MFKHLSLRAKFILGNCGPLLLVVIVGVLSAQSLKSLLDSNRWVDHTHTVIAQANAITAAAVDMETGMRGFLLAGKETFLDPYNGGYEDFKKRIQSLKETVSDNPAQVALLGEIESVINVWVEKIAIPQIALRREVGQGKSMDDIASLVGEAKGKQYFDRFREMIDTFIGRERVLMEARKDAAASTAAKAQNTLVWGIAITVIVSAILAIFIAGSVVRQFKAIFNGLKTFSQHELMQLGDRFTAMIEGLQMGASNVSTASEEVSTSSQQLADGSTQQAASIEEVSSTLEEIAALTRQNSENATEASRLSVEAKTSAMNGKSAMNTMAQAIDHMSDAVGRIKSSSDETSKIIKTIDEIAFQTNILALNAAVEAARAGEAGSGFAVVAEEVRNLAQRSAEAARNTANLIDSSVQEATGGVRASSEVRELLQRIVEENIDPIVEGIQKVNKINSEVAAASKEQTEGVTQVNEAVTQMSDLTQANASTAEESSAASEELSAQSEELKALVAELVQITSGDSGYARKGTAAQIRLE